MKATFDIDGHSVTLEGTPEEIAAALKKLRRKGNKKVNPPPYYYPLTPAPNYEPVPPPQPEPERVLADNPTFSDDSPATADRSYRYLRLDPGIDLIWAEPLPSVISGSITRGIPASRPVFAVVSN